MTTRELVYEFHEIFGAPIAKEPVLNRTYMWLRHELVREEALELIEAYTKNDIVEMADALGDLDYVLEGAGLTFGTQISDWSDQYNNPVMSDAAYLGDIIAYVKKFSDTLIQLENDEIDDSMCLYKVVNYLSHVKTRVYILQNRWDIPLKEIIKIIHESNMSKLGEDGKPVYYTEGLKKNKVKKGPNFFTPTAKIKSILVGS